LRKNNDGIIKHLRRKFKKRKRERNETGLFFGQNFTTDNISSLARENIV